MIIGVIFYCVTFTYRDNTIQGKEGLWFGLKVDLKLTQKTPARYPYFTCLHIWSSPLSSSSFHSASSAAGRRQPNFPSSSAPFRRWKFLLLSTPFVFLLEGMKKKTQRSRPPLLMFEVKPPPPLLLWKTHTQQQGLELEIVEEKKIRWCFFFYIFFFLLFILLLSFSSARRYFFIKRVFRSELDQSSSVATTEKIE